MTKLYYGHVRIGTQPTSGGAIEWVDDPFTTSPTTHWTLSHDLDTDDLVAEHAATATEPLRITSDGITTNDLRVAGEVTHTLTLGSATTHLAGFDPATNRHTVHYDDAATDHIFSIERTAANDYTLYVRQDGADREVVTVGGSGAIDADTLGGEPATGYVRTDGTHAMTGALDMGGYGQDAVGRVTFADAAADTATWTLSEDGTTGDLHTSVGGLDVLRAESTGDVRVPSGTLYQQGEAVLTTGADAGVDVGNQQDTPLVVGADAITAGTALSFSDDGDQTATLSFSHSLPGEDFVSLAPTASGDDSATTFTVTHDLGVIPSAVSVDAQTEAASGDFYITDATTTQFSIEYVTAPPTGADNLEWSVVAFGDTSPVNTAASSVTASGDDATTTFTLAHGLGEQPAALSIDPRTRAASPDFWVTNATATDVTIEYASAPPAGPDNLSWYVTATGTGEGAGLSVSDDGVQLLAEPTDLNFGAGLNLTDDGDNTASIATDPTVPRTTAPATIDAAWTFGDDLDVTADSTIGFANASGTTQFGFTYDALNDRHVWEDIANALPIAYVNRSAVVDFQEPPQVAGVNVATIEDDLANQGSGTAVEGAVPEADGNGNITWTRRSAATVVSADGDNSTAVFQLPHTLGQAPTGAFVQPETRPAQSAHRVTAKTSAYVEVTFETPPPAGTDNVRFNVITHV